MSVDRSPRIFLARHGQTEWSLNGRHTGSSELELTEAGVKEAAGLRAMLNNRRFDHVLLSPRRRAMSTCELVGLASQCQIVPDLAEWQYGDYEGRTSADIQRERPGWDVFTDGCPNGESPADMTSRMHRLIERLKQLEGDIICFSHGHILRSLGVIWIGQPLSVAANLHLSTASLSVLEFDHAHGVPQIRQWNATSTGL